MEVDEDDEENSSTVKRRKQELPLSRTSSNSKTKNGKNDESKKCERIDSLKGKIERRNSDDKSKTSMSKKEANSSSGTTNGNGNGTLNRSRKKNVAPQPPPTTQPSCQNVGGLI